MITNRWIMGRSVGVESKAVFQKTVKHLFRYLHDARRLGENPLVREMLSDSPLRKKNDSGRAALEHIHELVRKGAEYCRDADLRLGNTNRARRQYAIITLHCLEGRPIEQVAAELSISTNYCYRERAQICARVACYISEHFEPSFDYLAELDEFRLSLDRIVRNAGSTDKKVTLRNCERLASGAESKEQKTEALCELAALLLEFEDFKQAAATISYAKAINSEYAEEKPEFSAVIAKARVGLMEAKLAQYSGAALLAVQLSEETVLSLQPIQKNARTSLQKLYVESLYQLSTALWDTGQGGRSHSVLTEAEAGLRLTPSTALALRAGVMTDVWRMRNRLVVSARPYPFWQRIRGLGSAFEMAYGAGLIFQAAEALAGLAELHAFARNDGTALETGQLAISLSNQLPSLALRAAVVTDVATALRRTRHREYAMSLFSLAQSLKVDTRLQRTLAAFLLAEQALSLGEFRKAWSMALAGAQAFPNSAIAMDFHSLAAVAAHELGMKRDADTIIGRTIEQCATHGDAALLARYCSIGAQITGDPRLATRAKELSGLLSA